MSRFEGPFDVEVEFSGLCCFVPNAQDRGRTALVLLANAWDERPDNAILSLDGAEHPRHRAFLQFAAGDLDGAPGFAGSATAVLPTFGYALSFEARSDVARTELSPASWAAEAIPGLARSCDVCDDADFNLTEVVSDRTSDHLGASVLLEGGVVHCAPGPFSWRYDHPLHERKIVRQLNPVVRVTLGAVSSFAVSLRPLADDSRPSQWIAFRPRGSKLRLAVSNLCDDNPLRWGRPTGSPISPDLDYQLHFNVLGRAGRERIQEKLQPGKSLPMPVIEPNQPNGDTYNCDNLLAPPASFDPETWK